MAKKKKHDPEDEETRKWKDLVRKDRDYSAEQFDKQIVYISSGALVLTIGFVEKIVTITDATETDILIMSWILFVTSLMSILISHKTSIYAMDAELDGKDKRSENWDSFTELLNWLSVAALFTGIILFILFVINNI